MAEDSLTTNVLAGKAQIWALLLDWAERPEGYLPGVNASEVVERNDQTLTRRVVYADGPVIEAVRLDATRHAVRIDPKDPADRARVTAVVSGPDDAPFLTFEAAWDQQDEADPALMAALQTAMLTVKTKAEGV